MTILYVGDLHGDLNAMKDIDQRATNDGVAAIVQVGDFGFLWKTKGRLTDFDEYLYSRQSNIPLYTCGGNHENYDNWDRQLVLPNDCYTTLASNVFWMHRGSCLVIDGKKHLFLGGAQSTDKHLRVEGKTWWKQEMPTYQDLLMFSEALEVEKPDFVVTHDGPQDVVREMGFDWDSNLSRDLQGILDNSNHSPAKWYFGHYHTWQMNYFGNSGFYCCGAHGDGWHG